MPRYGLIARLRYLRRERKKELTEDALKYIFNCEYEKTACVPAGISAFLGISEAEYNELTGRLINSHLVSLIDGTIRLTPEGRSYALRIIRIHRLWEKYLADETSFPEEEWHKRAHRKEHSLTLEEANRLAERMGNPGYDPHGDPIPTANGELPFQDGQPLSRLAPGDVARVLHIEDEPAAFYAQCTAQGLFPGVQVMVSETDASKIRLVVNGEETSLAPALAANIRVRILSDEERITGKIMTLADLKPGEEGRVVMLSGACHGQQRRRLMDLGIVPGSVIRAEMESFSGDPTAYLVRGALIALRKHQARQIFVQPVKMETYA